ncbi:MAG: phosphoribosylamine--glycine ligase [Ignavibacteria bacterium]|nr:MAG: phosphoribosylamine--glycine ligase [Ignavibacteria bacterium]
MNILVIGGGGREHAICWKLKHSKLTTTLYCAPGNAGTSLLGENVAIKPTDIDRLLEFVQSNDIDLTVVGPEAPLAAGIVDRFREAGHRVFGPTRAAAQLETSKAFAKEFMKRHRIPTAGYEVFHKGDEDRLREYLRSASYPLVLKADGLAAGKGVIIAESANEAVTNAIPMLAGDSFGDAGSTLVVEEFLTGIEASVFALTDGNRFVTLAPAQDHKRILDHDLGKNTGGMGAFAPTPHMPTELLADVKIRIIKPVIDGMRADGIPYSGVLYVGLMLTEDGPKVLEFNCRFGDPETQAVLPLIDYDLAELLRDISDSKLSLNRLPQHDANAVCVVIASSGYPDAYETGKVIYGLDGIDESKEGVLVFHAGTKQDGNDVLTAGGRVLGVTALGEDKDFAASIRLAYNAVNRIRFDGAYYRTDIGRKAID